MSHSAMTAEVPSNPSEQRDLTVTPTTKTIQAARSEVLETVLAQTAGTNSTLANHAKVMEMMAQRISRGESLQPMLDAIETVDAETAMRNAAASAELDQFAAEHGIRIIDDFEDATLPDSLRGHMVAFSCEVTGEPIMMFADCASPAARLEYAKVVVAKWAEVRA